MTDVTLFVRLEIDPERRSDFIAIMCEHAKATLAEEEGCLAFRVLLPDAEERLDGSRHELGTSTICVYEKYRDAEAYRVHLESDRLQALRERYREMIVDRRIIRSHEVGV